MVDILISCCDLNVGAVIVLSNDTQLFEDNISYMVKPIRELYPEARILYVNNSMVDFYDPNEFDPQENQEFF